MNNRVLFFTANKVPTSMEALQIDDFLESYAQAPFQLVVVNSQESSIYGENNRLIPAGYVSGAVPENYKVEGEPVYEEIDLTSPPNPFVGNNQAIVSNEQTIEGDGGSVTFSIVDGVIEVSVTAA